ncbi:hypothetical protein FG386_001952 [Cryptosporidium ryanae]|uniref:uncharacterized protein n=1 Tax=Cryptosporidium ryanae TaxID=515981 RepID=UPI00351A2104|nr:hypothetical protein FG386_001952 [Cryptosporidium ryanae]
MGQVLNCDCCTEHPKCIVDQCEVEIVYPKCNYVELQRKMGYIPERIHEYPKTQLNLLDTNDSLHICR